MPQSLMLKSVYAELDGKPQPIILDLGYVSDEATRNRGDALVAFGLSRKRFSIEGNSRLMVELPPRNAIAVLAAFPIAKGSTYWRSTHHWQGLAKGESVAAVPAA